MRSIGLPSMSRYVVRIALALQAWPLAGLPLRAATPVISADLVLTHGKIWTVDPDNPLVVAVAIRDERIVAVGSSDSVGRLIGPETRVIDLKGRLVLPGFFDSHVHLLGGGAGLTQVRLDRKSVG